mmetsp:Transcript_13224/g.32133  ORF Transcript_13224/g.32133 Transcript_13224/m.32133 type:complete len:370 (-) Transcript_13224:205-1314(-)
MNDAIAQGAVDMDISLVFNSTANEGLSGQAKINQRMISLIEEYCGANQDSDRVNAILVTLPDSNIVKSLDACKLNNVQIAVFNAGPNIAVENDLLFYGMNNTLSGYMAGEALAKVNSTEKFCCSNHAPGVDVLAERCGGMAAGVEANGKLNTFDVTVDPDDCIAWEEAIISGGCTPDEGKDWSTIGLYLAGKANHKCGVQFLEKYPAAYVDASDVSQDLYAGMTAGLNVLFGIDQQSYLQGYMPFSTLTLAVTNNQMIENNIIQTGPKLITEPPSSHDQECESNKYEVCERTETVVDHPPLITTPGATPVESPTTSTPAVDPPAPSPATPQPSEPSSRALSQIAGDYSHHLTLAVGGFILAVGGLILAN